MILKYNDYMENIKITSEMRKRILVGIEEELNTEGKRTSGSNRRNTYIYRYALVAACLMCVVMAAALFPKVINYRGNISSENLPDGALEGDTGGEITQVGSPYVDYALAEELSEAMGYEIKEVTDVPFDVAKTAYTGIDNSMAQIIYTDVTGENELCFRMTKISDESGEPEDISGDYNAYDNVKELTTQASTITIKGSSGLYSLATWQDEGYVYSINVTNGVDEVTLQNVVESVK